MIDRLVILICTELGIIRHSQKKKGTQSMVWQTLIWNACLILTLEAKTLFNIVVGAFECVK